MAPDSAVIFDCDGVLFDSWHANVAYYDAVRARLGLAPMDAAWRELAHVLAASELLERMFADDPALLAAAHAAAEAVDYAPFHALMQPAEGLFEVLDALAARHRLAMASNRGRTLAGVVERFGLGRWMQAAVGVLDVPRPKPHPDVVLAALARLGVAPGRAVYVGDAPSDRAAAEGAGVRFVAVGTRPWAPLQVPTLRTLPALLAGEVLSGAPWPGGGTPGR